MSHPAAAPNEAKDFALLTLDSELTSNVYVEAEVTIADSNNWDYMFVLGDSTSTMATLNTNSLWSAINNETWQGHTTAWATAQSGLSRWQELCLRHSTLK
jgi:hypothetical protein